MRDIDLALGSLLRLLKPGMPKVVPDQRRKFEDDDLLRKLAEDNPIAYSPHRDKPIAERRGLMHQELQEGFITVAVCTMGITLRLVFDATPWTQKPNGLRVVTPDEVRLDENGRIHLKSRFILNGVCVQWLGHIDSQSLSGRGRVQFDADRAEVENQMLKDQLHEYHRLHGGFTSGGGGASIAMAVLASGSDMAAAAAAASSLGRPPHAPPAAAQWAASPPQVPPAHQQLAGSCQAQQLLLQQQQQQQRHPQSGDSSETDQ